MELCRDRVFLCHDRLHTVIKKIKKKVKKGPLGFHYKEKVNQ